MNKTTVRDIVVVTLFIIACIFVSLSMIAGVRGNSIFSANNIKKVSLYFLIVLPAVYIWSKIEKKK